MDKITKHIILGAGGAIGVPLANELLTNNEKIKLVSRKLHSIPNVESVIADLTNQNQVKDVIEENSMVYLLAGLQYNIKVWQESWPVIMKNTIEACKAKNAKLIFFDNVYMYGKVNGKMTEDTPVNPCSRKGEVRAKIAELLLSEIKQKNISALIARAADFYGPYSSNSSVPYLMVFSNLVKGKKAQWLANVNVKHSYSYTLDCSKGLYLLSKDNRSFNQIWHLPTASPAITGKEFIELTAKYLNVKPTYTVLTKWMVKAAGLFNKTIKEVSEMLYQNEYEYEFDSSKFEKHFHFTPTPYEKGIESTLKFFKESVQN
ncbi:MAG: NAD-dependent epimerase/dehydratase family protein [Ignavibacteriaceae bacterium]|nr:NAD-dependent epimerase/dehydratase family protein [Ignavibacteriaceae bacterium]